MKTWYGVLLIALMLSTACGGTVEPAPTAGPVDLEATVEAKVKAVLTAVPTLAPTPTSEIALKKTEVPVEVTSVFSKSSLTYVVVDTGQSKCYDNKMKIPCPQMRDSFHGQDAQYTLVEPRYVDNSDGTITDLNTGLMWQKNPGAKTTYEDALGDVESFQLGGYDDWRLPNIKELYSLIMFSGKDVSSCMTNETCTGTPFLDTAFFEFEYGDTSAGERIIDSQYMSSTEYVSKTMLGTQNNRPDLAKASSILGISEDALRAALGPPPPDLSVAANILGISEQDLIAALESTAEDKLSQGNETVFGVNFADGRIKGYPKAMGPTSF